MGRDDTSKDATLNQIVDNYATSVVVPNLSDFEAQVAGRFAEVTLLEGLAQDVAIAAAARSWDCERLKNRLFRPIWGKFADIEAFRAVVNNAINHIDNVFQKLGVSDRTQAVTEALRKGIIKL